MRSFGVNFEKSGIFSFLRGLQGGSPKKFQIFVRQKISNPVIWKVKKHCNKRYWFGGGGNRVIIDLIIDTPETIQSYEFPQWYFP